MIHATIIGRLGRDPETKEVGKDVVASFSVACDQGWGERKSTNWIRVSVWGARGTKLASMLAKGDRVAVRGALETAEKDGKTYLQMRADDVELLGGGAGEGKGAPKGSGSRPTADDLDGMPF